MRAVCHWVIVGLAGLAGVAPAQPLATEVKYQVRRYDANHNIGWVSSVEVAPGARVEVRVVVSYVGTGTVGGLGQVAFQPVLTRWADDDSLVTQSNGSIGGLVGPVGGTRSTPIGVVPDVPGRYGRISPWGANATTTSTFLRGHLGTGTASGLLRIAQNHITNWIGVGATSGATANNNVNGGGGVSIAQIANPARMSTDPAYESRTADLVVLKFAFVAGGLTPWRTITIDTPSIGFNRTLSDGVYVPNARWFAEVAEATPSVQTAAYSIPAEVRVLPSPGAVCLAAAALLPSGRRRRARATA